MSELKFVIIKPDGSYERPESIKAIVSKYPDLAYEFLGKLVKELEMQKTMQPQFEGWEERR